MAQQNINLGTPPAALDGDSARAAFQKVQANFTELYGAGGSAANSAALNGLTGAADRLPVFTGPGAMALKPVQSSATDATANALLAMGAFGWGSSGAPVYTDWNAVPRLGGMYDVADTASNRPAGLPAGFYVLLGMPFGNFGYLAFNISTQNLHKLYRSGTDNSWTYAGKIYDSLNILGTVSQSAGVPTGAVIERGSNANGQYVRFADGTQECWITSRSLPYADSGTLISTWTFPASFVDTNIDVSVNVTGSVPANVRNALPYHSVPSATTVGLYMLTGGTMPFSSGDVGTVSAHAIGRWF